MWSARDTSCKRQLLARSVKFALELQSVLEDTDASLQRKVCARIAESLGSDGSWPEMENFAMELKECLEEYEYVLGTDILCGCLRMS